MMRQFLHRHICPYAFNMLATHDLSETLQVHKKANDHKNNKCKSFCMNVCLYFTEHMLNQR